MKQGNLPITYLNSVLDVYEFVLQKSQNYSGNAAGKVKQEILHGLGNAFSSRWFYEILHDSANTTVSIWQSH